MSAREPSQLRTDLTPPSVALVGLVAACAAVALDRSGLDLAAMVGSARDIAVPWAGPLTTLSFGMGLAAVPPALAVAARHPLLNRPLRRPGATPVSGMRGFWHLTTAYWTSERWLEAWTLTVTVAAITTLISMSSVWVATAAANFLSAIVSFHGPPDDGDPVAILVTATALFAAVNLGRFAVTGVRHFASNTLHRKARRWTQAQFNAALLGRRHVAMTLMSDRDTGSARLPDNIDQRIDECSTAMYGGIIGLSMGIWGAVTSIYFVSSAIIERSVAVPFLENWFAAAGLSFSPGDYGSALLVALLILVYVPLSTLGAWAIGRILERQTLQRQAREASWRGELNATLVRANQIAISGGQRVQQRTNANLYRDIDDVWHRMNLTQASVMVFNDSYAFLSKRLVSYLPALPGYVAGELSFRRYSAISELAAQLIDDCSWFIQVMPAIVTLRAHTRRLGEVAEAIHAADDQERFHRESGVHAFRRLTQDPCFGLTLKGVALYHRGHDGEPFATVRRLNLRPGQWAYVRGDNGCGKSSLLKAIAGIWPYGAGEIITPDGAKIFFAGQDADLPTRLTLKALVTYPEFPELFADAEIAHVLAEVGLGKFIRELGEPLHHGKPWNDIFSGGQRQRLVLARILLQQPDVILLDEACAALDPAGTIEFHRLLKEHCRDAVVLSIMHMPEPPVAPNGRPFYDRILYFKDGLVDLHPVRGALVPVAAE